jgi:hypothetical protein
VGRFRSSGSPRAISDFVNRINLLEEHLHRHEAELSIRLDRTRTLTKSIFHVDRALKEEQVQYDSEQLHEFRLLLHEQYWPLGAVSFDWFIQFLGDEY